MIHKVSCEVGGKTLTIETGKMAKQADGSVLVSYGDTRVLVTAVSAKQPKENASFFPLTVEFAEKFYAAGRIPGSFHRREGRPTTEATLSARMIDRPIRPLFPEGYQYETQVVATILSLDLEADIDVAAGAGVGAALHISDIPFNGPSASCRMGRINGQFVVAPPWTALHNGESELEILVAGTAQAITMVEGAAQEVSEDILLEAVLLGHKEIQKITAAIEELRKLCGRPKREFVPPALPADVVSQVKKHSQASLEKAFKTREKQSRYEMLDEAEESVVAALVTDSFKKEKPEEAKTLGKDVKTAFENLKYSLMREMILGEKVRIDGRDTRSIRPITVEAGLLPRVHGSSLFTRGETQVLAAVTLGTGDDEQIIDTVHIKEYGKFLFHYNFPPYSVGETGRFGGQSRREIGHGVLAERSVKAMMPKHDDFPYTVRVVCETLESNGSSSMGSVCSASMALMDAGVPLPKPIAGIAMGLIKEQDRVAVLSDILGDEDHLGDMDFKVAGTRDGVTGIQMDIKIAGVSEEILRSALAQAREGRLHILGKMAEAIDQPRTDLSKYAPRITTVTVPIDKIGLVVGPQGKMVKSIVAATGCKVDINDDGKIHISSNDGEAAKKAIQMVKDLVAVAEINKVYKGVVRKITDFGAFVGILPTQDGLLHISEIAHERVNRVEDYMREGDTVEVKVVDIDPSGKIRLSRKVLLPMPEGGVPLPPAGSMPPRGPSGPGRGDRFGGGGGRGGRGSRDRGPSY